MEPSNSARAPIDILIAVAVRLYRDGLAAALGAQEHLRIMGTAGTPTEVLAGVRDLRPHLVIVDVSLEDILSLMRALRAASSNSRILAIAVREEISTILNYAEAGADGFVTANSSVAELVEAIKRTAAGELLCSPRIAAQLLQRATHHGDTPTQHVVGHGLTSRELQVLSLLKQGRSNKEIAITLNIAGATVKNHVHHLLEKLQVATRGKAVAAAVPLMRVPFEQHLSSRPGT